MFSDKNIRKKVIRLVLRESELDAFEEVKKETKIFRDDDVLRHTLLSYGKASAAQAQQSNRSGAGRPRSEDKADIDRLCFSILNMNAEEVMENLERIGFIKYWKEIEWANDPAWVNKKIYTHESNNGTGTLSVKLACEGNDILDQTEIPAQLKKFYKWKKANGL